MQKMNHKRGGECWMGGGYFVIYRVVVNKGSPYLLLGVHSLSSEGCENDGLFIIYLTVAETGYCCRVGVYFSLPGIQLLKLHRIKQILYIWQCVFGFDDI